MKRRQKITTPPQTVVRMKAVWIWEWARAEWARSASGSPGPSVGWVRLREITIIQEPKGGEREACRVNRLPLLSCMDVAHSQGPRSCTSTTLYWMWLLNLFTLGVFSLCNQYSLLLQRTAGTELQEWYRLKECLNCQLALELLKLLSLLSLIRLTTSFAFKTGVFQGHHQLRAFHQCPL